MEDIGKFILYALAVGVYYFIKDRKKSSDTPVSEQPAAKPFMSPAADISRPVARQPELTKPTSLDDLVRRYTEQPGAEPMQRPAPMLEDKVRQSHRRATQENASLEGDSLEKLPARPVADQRSLEGPGYSQQIPQYRNEANEVDYEVPGKDKYQGLNDASQPRFKEFATSGVTINRYAELLKRPGSAADAFVLGEIFRRKEW